MICVDEMLATAGTVRSAMREKSGSVVDADGRRPAPVTTGAGVAGACAAASSAVRIFPVMTMPAARPRAAGPAAKTSRLALIVLR